MRNFTRLISCAFAMILFFTVSTSAQTLPIDPAVEVVTILNSGNGIIETIINGDTLTGGIRANPTRIYELEASATPFIMVSEILFGGSQDSTSTLTIRGAVGAKKPMVISTPKDGGDMFTNNITGSLKLHNLYWPTMATNGTGAVLFRLSGTNQRLEISDFIHENQVRGDVVSLGGVKGEMDIFLTNCYFRDMTQFQNPWNYAIFTRGDGNAIDTLWMENVTVANGGLLVMNKYCPVNFAFFNHNTIQNIPRYWNFLEQWKEVYFTNNVFINCLWQGEMTETMLSQLQSQTEYGPANGGVPVGLINLMRPSESHWELAFPGTTAPTVDDVTFLAANNLNFTSPFLDNYYNGGFNDTADYPVSMVDWSFATGIGLPGPPQVVQNIPAMFFSPSTDSLITEYPAIKASTNHIQVDPDMNTKMILDQAEGDAYAGWARNNYNLGVTMPDRLLFTIGDYDATTIPGPEGENGTGMANVRDLPEDFTYNSTIVSTIDGMKLGAQEWYGDISDWDSEDQLAKVKAFYLDPTVGVEDQKIIQTASVTIYPNPTSDFLSIESESELSNVSFFDVTGRMVKQIDLNGELKSSIDVSEMNKGIYILQVVTTEGESSSSKIIKK